MLNRKYYGFERNNYYYGKLLTSKDFQEEQCYFSGKRRFENRSLYGVGILKGMDVVMADDTSIIIQSGLALDAGGREVVVPETQVIKLATIDGYENLTTETACLGIAYEENLSDPVYSAIGINGADQGEMYNRIKEGYRLFILDEKDCIPVVKKDELFLHKTRIYEDKDIRITQIIPKIALQGKQMKSKVILEKLSHNSAMISVNYTIELQGFVDKEIVVSADNLLLAKGEIHTMEHLLTPEDYVFGSQDIQATIMEVTIQKAEKRDTTQYKYAFIIETMVGSMQDYLLREYREGAMDVELENRIDEKIWIAKIHLITAGNSTIIDSIGPAPYDQYIYTTEQVLLIHTMLEYFQGKAEVGVAAMPSHIPTTSVQGNKSDGVRTRSSGVFEMSFGNGGEAGRNYLSDEIMHGLGSGAVYVKAGIEYISKDSATNKNREEIIIGDNTIFANAEAVDEKLHQVDTAVKILPDRGTFVLGVRPKVKTGKMSLRIRWYAFKTEDIQQRVAKTNEQKGCIMIQPDTILLSPKEVAHINPVFINMPEEALTFTLLDPNGGKVDKNGVYTAPAQEGVYEVKAACISDPDIFTHAFIIVSQKKS